MHEMSGADALLAQLLANGVHTVFGLPGGQLDHFFDSMHRAGDRVRFIGSRHEQGAAYMAFGYARSTGKPGVYCVVPGPGVLNTTAALCSAYATNAPVFCLTGQIPSEGLGCGIGYLHELPDQLATLRTLTRWSGRVMSPEDGPAAINEAFEQMLGGRQGPVSLEMPMDIMGQRRPVALLPAAATATAAEVDRDAAMAAAKLMAKSRTPIIIAGGGATTAHAEVNELAKRLQAPVVTFLNGRGLVSDRSHLSQNLPAGYELWRTADLAIGIGSRMEQQYLHWGMPPGVPVVRIDIDPKEIARHRPAHRCAQLRRRRCCRGGSGLSGFVTRQAGFAAAGTNRPQGEGAQAHRIGAAANRLFGRDPRRPAGRGLSGGRDHASRLRRLVRLSGL